MFGINLPLQIYVTSLYCALMVCAIEQKHHGQKILVQTSQESYHMENKFSISIYMCMNFCLLYLDTSTAKSPIILFRSLLFGSTISEDKLPEGGPSDKLDESIRLSKP